MAKVFITNYALTKGICEEEAEIKSYKDGTTFAYTKKQFTGYKIGSEAFYRYEDAVVKAEELRQKKIASLKKQIEKMEKLSFKNKNN